MQPNKSPPFHLVVCTASKGAQQTQRSEKETGESFGSIADSIANQHSEQKQKQWIVFLSGTSVRKKIFMGQPGPLSTPAPYPITQLLKDLKNFWNFFVSK